MPDDPLFPDNTEGDPTQGDPPTGETPLTMTAGAELVTQALAPLVAQIEQQGEVMTQMATRLTQPPAPVAAEPKNNGADEDFLTRLSVDPEAAVAGIVTDQFKTVVPLMSNLINSATSAFVGLEATEIDTEFGPGAWNKFFDKPLGVVLDAYRANNAQALSDRNTVTNEVNGLKGKLLNELVDYREESRKTATEKSETKNKELVDGVLGQVRTNMTGGIQRAPGAEEEVTDELKGYLAEREAAIGGDKVDPKKWLKEKSYGNSLKDYLKHQESLKAEGGK